MNKVRHIIPLFIILALVISSCSLDEPLRVGKSSSDALRIVGRPTPFQTLEVDTKATKNDDESTIWNMAMFVFAQGGARVDYQFIEESKPLFIIDRGSNTYKEYSDQDKLENSSIYILANIPSSDRSVLAAIMTEDDLKEFDFSVSSVIRTTQVSAYGGLPMWGKMPNTVNLREPASGADDPLKGSVLEIPMTCLFAKVDLNFAVNPTQKSDFVQKFRMTSWTVENVPSKVRIGQPTGDSQYHDQSASSMLSGTFSSVDKGTNPVLEGGSTPMSFSFYVPEHRLTPSKTSIEYPGNIDNEHKQMFKPEWLSDGENPIKVMVKGVYTDHRNVEKEVTYTLYPGGDNWKDFYVNRDYEYINDISILGISNSKNGDAASVSLDTRVDVKQNQYKFELERETLLDSHWEIRPIRITLDPGQYPGSHIEVAIVDANGKSAAEGGSIPNWIRLEMPGGYSSIQGNSDYCDVTSQTDLACGKRRYFTTNLVSSTLANSSSATFTAETASNSGSANSHEHTIWVYIDENVANAPSSGSNTRQATVRCRFFLDADNTTTPDVEENYYFIQKSLHKITYNGRPFYIEYFEEYLYNFDSKDKYGTTTDGMKWGLDGKQISQNNYAIYIKGRLSDNIANSSIQSQFPGAKYDFYNSFSESAGGHLAYYPYGGLRFTKQIVGTKNKINEEEYYIVNQVLPTNSQPTSAVEYCLNRNKRDSEGNIAVDGIKWYLPSIDQIEDICAGGYHEFDVFQNKYYWSSQPAYSIFGISYKVSDWGLLGTSYGNFFMDNVNFARATKVDNNGNTVTSGETNPKIQHNFTLAGYEGTSNLHSGEPTKGPGNQSRNTENRVRCIYSIPYTATVRSRNIVDFEEENSSYRWTFSNISTQDATITAQEGSAHGVTSGRTAYMVTSTSIASPKNISCYISRHNDSDGGKWYIQTSSNGNSWTDVASVNTNEMSPGEWYYFSTPITSTNVYIRIYHQFNNKSGLWPTYNERYIDNVVLEYEETVNGE